MTSIRNKVSIIGVGCTTFGENVTQGLQDMVVEATLAACDDASVGLEDIEAAWLGVFSPGFGGGKGSITLADALRLYNKPITRVENFCATGTDAFRQAAIAVASGLYRIALIVGAEKLRDRPVRGLQREGVHPYLEAGSTAPGLFALAANRYMKEFGLSRSALAKVAVKNRRNGVLNPKAHLQRAITEEDVLEAPIIAWPFGVYDCCPVTDGAAAVIICASEVARGFRPDHILLKGVGLAVASGKPFYDPGFSFVGFASTQEAAKVAYEMAGIRNPSAEIDFAEVHDCFTWTEICNYEDLGFCAKGLGGRLIEEGRTAPGGAIPVNTSGGLGSFGHPVGATGIRMIYETVSQLRGDAGARQVQNAHIGLVHNLGGPGSVACVAIFGQP